MRESFMHRTFGRQAFGCDPGGYHAARPAYPDWVFDALCERRGLAPNAVTFEIGAGTGTATRRLLELGANPLLAVEPDGRLATFLRETIPDKALTVVVAPFEEAVLQEASFDLGFSATAFHWLTEDLALTKVAKLLRPGGWWAMVWNVFGDSHRPDPFHEATKSLLNGSLSPSAGNGEVPFALDAEARLAALERTHAFDNVDHRTSAWSLALDPDQTAALYATYSNINIRPDREAVLTELHRLARDEFHGRKPIRCATSVLVFRSRRATTDPARALPNRRPLSVTRSSASPLRLPTLQYRISKAHGVQRLPPRPPKGRQDLRRLDDFTRQAVPGGPVRIQRCKG
jgi:SAM-dependent methyltransferase